MVELNDVVLMLVSSPNRFTRDPSVSQCKAKGQVFSLYVKYMYCAFGDAALLTVLILINMPEFLGRYIFKM